MKYHLEADKLLGHQLRVGKPVNPWLPEAVAEWYSFEGAVELLAQYSNQDKPLSPEEFRQETLDNQQSVVFMIENQGVCRWAFLQDGQADPAVYVIFETTPLTWTCCCDQFSTFIYTRLFDFRHWHDPKMSRMEIGIPLSEELLNELRKEYIEHPITFGWPGDVQYRLSKGDQRIVLWKSREQTDWYLSTDSPQGLEEIYQKYNHLYY